MLRTRDPGQAVVGGRVVIPSRLDAELAAALQRAATRRGVSASALIRDLVHEHLSKEKEDE